MDMLEMLKEMAKDLDKADFDELYKFISELELNHIFRYPLPVGTEIIRIRPSESEPFTHKSQISYNSANPSDKYGRANNRKQPMFYGSIRPPGGFSPYAASFAEMNHILANGNYKLQNNSIELTFGEWKVKESFYVIPIAFNNDFLKENKEYRRIKQTLSDSNEVSNREIEELEYISEEFAKSEIKSHLDYKITAAFANYVIDKNRGIAEAITYPSVRSNGKGYNICLTPSFVDKYLELTKVFTAMFYWKYDIGMLDSTKSTDRINPDGSFKLKEIIKSGIMKNYTWYMNKIEEMKNKGIKEDEDYDLIKY